MTQGGQSVDMFTSLFDEIRSTPSDRPFVIAQLGQSLDGRIATSTGDSRWINGECALNHLHRLRACVDAVVVGVGTVIADDPRLTVRRVEGRNPTRVVIDPNGRMPCNAQMLHDGAASCLIIRADEGASTTLPVPVVPVARDGDQLAPLDVVRALFERGLSKILIEGGATTISRFIDARAINQLHVLVAPVIIGSGISGLELRPVEKLADARRPRTRCLPFEDGDVLFVCEFSTALPG